MTRRAFLQCLAGALLVSGGLGGAGYAFMRKKMFGALPDEDLIRELMRSSHYYNGEFHSFQSLCFPCFLQRAGICRGNALWRGGFACH